MGNIIKNNLSGTHSATVSNVFWNITDLRQSERKFTKLFDTEYIYIDTETSII